MPTVPSSFVPQVGMTGEGSSVAYQAPPVMPMEEAASRQQMELGRAMTAAGDTAFKLGSAMQDDIDDAATKEADTALIQRMSKVRSDYMNLSGKDAETQYQAAQDAMSSSASDIMDGLGNDTQKRMFQQVAARNMNAFQGQMYDHRNRQVKEWATSESATRADQYSDLAIMSYSDRNKTDEKGNPIGLTTYQANLATAISEVRKAASLNGIPEDSAQLKAMEQKVYDKVATGIVNDLLAAKQYGEAESFLSEHPVDVKVDTTLRSSIDANRQRTTVEELTSSIMQHGVLASASNPKTYPNTQSETDIAPASLQDALEVSNEIKDVDQRRMVQANLRTQFAQAKEEEHLRYQSVVEGIEQRLAEPGSSVWDIPQDQWGALKPKDREVYLTKVREKDEVGVLEEMARDPKKKQDPAYVESIRNKVTPSTYIKLIAAINKPDTIKQFAATVDAEQVNATLAGAGLMTLADPGNDDKAKAQSWTLRENIKTAIDSEQGRLNRGLSYQEKQHLIDQQVMHTAKKIYPESTWLPHFLGGGESQEELGPITSQQPEVILGAYETVDGKTSKVIPDSVRKEIEASLSRNGVPVTAKNIVRTWIQGGMKR